MLTSHPQFCGRLPLRLRSSSSSSSSVFYHRHQALVDARVLGLHPAHLQQTPQACKT